MLREIQLGDQKVEMLASGFTTVLYNKLFKRNVSSDISAAAEGDAGISIDTAMYLGFVMAKQAETPTDFAKLSKLGEIQFYKWVNEFEPMDFINAGQDITQLYLDQKETTSEAKN